VLLLVHFPCVPRPLSSSPTRRSSDPVNRVMGGEVSVIAAPLLMVRPPVPPQPPACPQPQVCPQRPRRSVVAAADRGIRRWPAPRSEEHTSELQSRFDLVCRLLLEKKK